MQYLSANCANPINGIDLVTGTPKTYYASTMRNIESLCGSDAKLYEPKLTKRIWQFLSKM